MVSILILTNDEGEILADIVLLCGNAYSAFCNYCMAEAEDFFSEWVVQYVQSQIRYYCRLLVRVSKSLEKQKAWKNVTSSSRFLSCSDGSGRAEANTFILLLHL